MFNSKCWECAFCGHLPGQYDGPVEEQHEEEYFCINDSSNFSTEDGCWCWEGNNG